MNPMNSSNAEINLHPKGIQAKTSFGQTRAETLSKPQIQNPSSNFHKQGLILLTTKEVNLLNS